MENDNKGTYGAYSSAGKNSAEIFANVRRKDKILNPQNYLKNKQAVIDFLKRNGYHNIHGDEEELKKVNNEDLDESQLEEVEEEIDIFKLEAKKNFIKKQKSIQKKQKSKSPGFFHRTDKEAYKFHDLHRLKGTITRPDTTPTCTKYLPSKKLVWPRNIIWPAWESMEYRKLLWVNKKGEIDAKYYLNHEDVLKNVGKCFIDMNKQTMRGDIVESHNLRINTTRPFSSMNINSKNKNNKKYSSKKTKKLLNKNKYSIISSESEKNKDIFDINQEINNNINLKWKTKRGTSAATSSTRPQTGKPFNVNTFHSRPTTTNSPAVNSNNYNNINTTESKNNNNKSNNNSLKENSDFNDSNSSSELNDSYHKYKHIYQKQIKNKLSNSTKLKSRNKLEFHSVNSSNKDLNITSNKNVKNIKQKDSNKNKNLSSSSLKQRPKSMLGNVRYMVHKKKINAPDFDKIISREYYANLDDRGSSLIPFSLPNFKQVRERPLTMVVYERPHYTKRKPIYMKGIEPSLYNDQYKYIEFINNYTRCVPPNLDKMMARPFDNGSPLPVYMKGCVSREGCNITTDISLKMNNYAEGKFLSNYTSFWPKKSYNKIINLNLLNSEAFVSNLVPDINVLKKNKGYVAKSIKFYNKNYQDLMKEGLLTKFDNVTYKTIRPNTKINPKDLDKFLKNYETNIEINKKK